MKKFKEYLNERALCANDAEAIIDAVSIYCDDKALEIENDEPYAINTIEEYRTAARRVSDIMWELDE